MTSGNKLWFENFLDASTPWRDRENLPAKEDGVDYGVLRENGILRGKEFTRCSPEEMEQALADKQEIDGKISHIAIPAFDRLIPPSFLYAPRPDTPKSFYQKQISARIRSAGIHCLIWGAAIYFTLTNPAYAQYMIMAVLAFIMFGFGPLIDLVSQNREVAKADSIDTIYRQQMDGVLFHDWVKSQSAYYLFGFLIVLIAVFALQMNLGLPESWQKAGLLKMQVRQGEWWRMLTCGLLHGEPLHIIFNGAALFQLGRIISAAVHPLVLAIVFTVSVLGGSFASLYFTPFGPVSVGASGGILGCLGFLAAVAFKCRKDFPPSVKARIIIGTITISVLGLVGFKFIDNAAHAGGFVAGLLLGIAYASMTRKWWDYRPSIFIKALSVISLIALLGATVQVVRLLLAGDAG